MFPKIYIGLAATLILKPAFLFAAEGSRAQDKKSAVTSKSLLIYTARNEELLLPVIEAYKKETGVEISLLTDQAPALIQRLLAEGARSKADILMTVDAGNLWEAGNAGVLQALTNETIDKNIPAHLRDPDHKWVGLSLRSRTIVYNPSKVKEAELSTYEDLASEKWRGRLCLRTSKKVYNQSLVAMFLADWGPRKTESIVQGWVANLAQPVYSNDTDVIKAVAAGSCDVGIVNTYYYGREIKANPNLSAKLFWANQGTTGVHVNVSGAGITKYAPQRAEAEKFLQWLTEPSAQNLFAEVNMEFPANPKVPASNIVRSWGDFKSNPNNLSMAGKLQVEAVKIMDRAGYR